LHVSAKIPLSEKRQTYNLTVEGASTYFVGRNEVLVHNTDCSKGVQIYGADGQIKAELDQVRINQADPGLSVIVENKNGYGLRGAPDGQVDKWIIENVSADVVRHIEAIEATGVKTVLQPGASSGSLPSLVDLQGIKSMQFMIQNGDPILIAKVQTELDRLGQLYPNWTFSVKVGK
jgi:hypothetical protein